MRLPGELSISRPSGGREDPYICIRVEDSSSHVGFLEIRVPLAEFSMCLTGLAAVGCSLELRGLDKLGMEYQHKTETVKVPDGEWSGRDERAQLAVSAWEVDGWKGRVEDALNHHRFAGHEDGARLYHVSFNRHVARGTG